MKYKLKNESGFNIFEILSKDDKELIHSAFLAFLFKESNNNISKILNINEPINGKVKVETEVPYGKKDRIDIQITYANTIIIIENKFKSFPSGEQTNRYNALLNKSIFNKFNNKKKYLFVFSAKSVVKDEFKGWKTIDYSEIYKYVEEIYLKEVSSEKKTFIKHYLCFLDKYIKEYKKLLTNNNNSLFGLFELFSGNRLGGLFENYSNNKNFWLRLINSELKQRLEANSKIKPNKIIQDKGGPRVPLMNILFEEKKWRPKNGVTLLIQFQGPNLKLYCQYKHDYKNNLYFKAAKKIANKITNNINNRIKEEFFGKTKKVPKNERENKREESSFYIYQENILNYRGKKNMSLEWLESCIINFHNKIEQLL